ncbi:NYN domain-containing protein [Mycolicibacterium palauense]|uniref:NYN domain-containing protein n=1 Tax=Mycolicibacterium palauense TaxID=2034511 RepID=UPI000BFEAA89|nr:NYN domain-containing protein [Mycolicibacterium palauense]
MRWIVDAMNVIGTRPDGWWRNRRAALTRLVGRLEQWSAAERQPVTVVFEHPMSPPISSSVITIRHAPAAAADSADDEIVRLVESDERPDELTVVTSDATLARRVRQAGATVYAAARFRDLLDDLPD